ncbi:unnamed protein product [Prorocentrum cordatum]|uniref:Uncharacterized protein n=1 Tax=Prorocentrum cordatum TaxID=2364126 RepID=A0ABN9RFH6_9DINO|nr:unnamed protein product [Polarella glacialis]
MRGASDWHDWANDAIDVMNVACAPGAQPSAVGISEGQRASLERVQSAFTSLISWPDVCDDPVPLTSVVAGPDAQRLGAWSSRMLRDRGEADALLQQVCPRGPYVDPHLSFSPATYADFLAQMLKRKMICFQAEDPNIKPIGVFCVAQKSNRLRLIFDTRTANAYFSDPPATALPSAAAFANLEAPGGRVVIAAGNIDNAFYRLKMPDGLCSYFRLPPIDRRHLEARGISGLPSGGRLQACLVVLPMGFSWAPHSCQLALKTAVARTGVPAQLIIEDGLPGVVSGPDAEAEPAAAGYVDNYLSVGAGEGRVDQALDRIAGALEPAGLRVHAPERAAESCSFLGMELRRGRWLAIKGRSVWRLRFAIEELLRRGRASGHLMRVVFGHLTWSSMARREARGILNATYAFMAAAGAEAQSLWPAVRTELWRARCLLLLLVADLAAPWASRLVASDASEEGLGVRRRQAPNDLIARCGRQCERHAGRRPATKEPMEISQSPTSPVKDPSHDLGTFGVSEEPPPRALARRRLAAGQPRVLWRPARRSALAASQARERRAALARRPLAERPPLGQLSALETMAVRSNTESQHRRVLEELVAFCQPNRVDWSDFGQLDATATRSIAWQRRAPAMTRAPLPCFAAAATAGMLAMSGRRRMAIWILLTFSCYLRPFEAQGLRGLSLVRPADLAASSAGSWAPLLHPTSGGRPGKTDLYNESVVIDLDLHLCEQFREIASRLQLQALDPTLYAPRRGGASWDLLEGRRTLEQTQRHGRWASPGSMKRYAKEAYLQDAMTRVPEWAFVLDRVAHANLREMVELGPGLRQHPRLRQQLPAPAQALIEAGLPQLRQRRFGGI